MNHQDISMEDHIDETLNDLADDIDELLSLVSSAGRTLAHVQKFLQECADAYVPATYGYIEAQARSLADTYEGLVHELRATLHTRESWRHEDISRLIAFKKEKADLVRTLQSTLASVCVAGNWQSPSFDHTVLPQAGTRTRRVRANLNDYLRDYNLDEDTYAKRFAEEYIDHPLRLRPQVYFTSSCMAALTTALANIHANAKEDDIILVGQASYFQNKLAAEHFFPGKIRYVDESDSDGLVELARTLQPVAILLDTLCGTDSLVAVDFPVLLPKLSSVLSRKTTLVLDNTSLATFCQPLKFLPLRPLGMQLIVVASLSKYYEFGFDRVNGGVMWTPIGSALELASSRTHLGTIMPDASLYALPMPDRRTFDRRLQRIGRNALILAQRLQTAAHSENTSVSHIVYPGLPSHISHAVVQQSSFKGGTLVVAFTKEHQTASWCDTFAHRVMKAARAHAVDLIAGTGFGFSSTRLYYTTTFASTTMKPFVRLSAGTETRMEIEALADAIQSAITAS